MARSGEVRRGSQWLIYNTRLGLAWLGEVRLGLVWHGSQWLIYNIDGSGSVGCGEVRQGAAWHGKAREPMAHLQN
jgi:hypothetical protein